jgi:hypothetical protein
MHFSSSFAKGLAGVALSSAFVLCSLWVNGCTAIVNDATDYCSSNSDCSLKGGAYANSVCRDGLCRDVAPPVDPTGADWSCVGKVEYKPAQETPSSVVTVYLIDPFSGGPLPGLRVRPCGRVDATCASPLLPDWLTTDQFGAARVPVPTNQATQGVPGFTGYLEIVGDAVIPYLYFLNPPVIAARDTTFPIGTPEQAGAFYAGIEGFQPLPDRGTGAVVAKDCKGVPAAGVRVEILEGDEQLKILYLAGVAPSPDATQTSAPGLAFIFNAPNGTATINTYRTDTNALTSKVSVLFRPGHSTFVEMEPTPLLTRIRRPACRGAFYCPA